MQYQHFWISMFPLIHLKHLPTNGLFNPDILSLSKRRVKLNTARPISGTEKYFSKKTLRIDWGLQGGRIRLNTKNVCSFWKRDHGLRHMTGLQKFNKLPHSSKGITAVNGISFCFQYTKANLKFLLLFSFPPQFKLHYSQLWKKKKFKGNNTTS